MQAELPDVSNRVLEPSCSGGPLPTGEWYFTMAALTGQTAALPNYRFFIEDGTFHTFIFSDDQFYQSGANGVSVADWISAMIKPGNRPWDNLDAGAPF